jgi:hypothetical protein
MRHTLKANAPCLVLAIATLSLAPHALAGSFTYTSIPLPAWANNNANANGINNNGQIVGYAPAGPGYGMIWNNGSFTQVNYQNLATAFTAVNDAGIAVGYTIAPRTALSYDIGTGKFTALKTIGTEQGPSAINDAGAIVGTYSKPKGRNLHGGFFMANSKKKPSKVAFPSSASTYPNLIDNNGVIYGSYNLRNGDLLGFVDTAKSFSEFTGPDGETAYPDAVSNGVIFGSYTVAPNTPYTFALISGAYTTYQCPTNTGLSGMHLVGAVAGGGVAGTCDYSTGPQSFVQYGSQYYAISPPGAVQSSFAAESNNGILLGTYTDGTNNYFFTATCQPGQAPCTQ